MESDNDDVLAMGTDRLEDDVEAASFEPGVHSGIDSLEEDDDEAEDDEGYNDERGNDARDEVVENENYDVENASFSDDDETYSRSRAAVENDRDSSEDGCESDPVGSDRGDHEGIEGDRRSPYNEQEHSFYRDASENMNEDEYGEEVEPENYVDDDDVDSEGHDEEEEDEIDEIDEIDEAKRNIFSDVGKSSTKVYSSRKERLENRSIDNDEDVEEDDDIDDDNEKEVLSISGPEEGDRGDEIDGQDGDDDNSEDIEENEENEDDGEVNESEGEDQRTKIEAVDDPGSNIYEVRSTNSKIKRSPAALNDDFGSTRRLDAKFKHHAGGADLEMRGKATKLSGDVVSNLEMSVPSHSPTAKNEPHLEPSPTNSEIGPLGRPRRHRRRPQRWEGSQPSLSRRTSSGGKAAASPDSTLAGSSRQPVFGAGSAAPVTRRSIKPEEDSSTVSIRSSESSSPPPETVDPLDQLENAKRNAQCLPDSMQAIAAFHAWQLRTISAESSYQKSLHAYLKRRLRKRISKSQEQDRLEEEALRNACSAPSKADSCNSSASSDDVRATNQICKTKKTSGKRGRSSDLGKGESSVSTKKRKTGYDDIVPEKVRLPLESYFPRRIRKAASPLSVEEFVRTLPSSPPRFEDKPHGNSATSRRLNIRVRLPVRRRSTSHAL